MNLTGEMVTTLDLELVGPDGTVLATARLDGDAALAPSGHLSLFIDQIPWDQEIDFSDFMGLIRVRPSGAGSTTSRRCTRAGLRLVDTSSGSEAVQNNSLNHPVGTHQGNEDRSGKDHELSIAIPVPQPNRG